MAGECVLSIDSPVAVFVLCEEQFDMSVPREL